jgi:hypothetical protein
MRSVVLGSLTLGLAGSLISVGCGDDEGSGGSAATTTAETSTTATTGSPTTTTTQASTSTGTSGCIELTPEDFVRSNTEIGSYFFATPEIGGSDPDSLNLEFYIYEKGDPYPTGTIDLSAGENGNYNSCSTCVLLLQDVAGDGSVVKYFFQQSGTMELGTTSHPFISGSVSDVTLVEVTIDPDYTTTPVPGGECLHVASATFDFEPPPPEWVCVDVLWGDKLECNCGECGVADSDCVAGLPDIGCEDGQTCNVPMGVCEGVPTSWTCPADQYNGGVGNGCDCACGALDPDCVAIMGEPVENCGGPGFSCTLDAACVPTAWTCDPTYYGEGTMDSCDCGCGAADSDCENATVGVCDYCLNPGSCAENEADCSTIDPANNAVCQ